MTTTDSTTFGESFGILAFVGIVVGLFVFGYGLVLVPTSLLGGAWIAAIGLSVLLSGVFSTAWAGDRVGLATPGRRRLSLAFSALAALLLVAFVVVNVF